MSILTQQINSSPDVIAPDGSEVRILCQAERGSMAHFTLPPKPVSRAVAHHTIDEIWYFITGCGRMWRHLGTREEVVEVGPDLSITILVGTHFQFRSDGDEPPTAIGATMPPWPGDDEVYTVEGPWKATV